MKYAKNWILQALSLILLVWGAGWAGAEGPRGAAGIEALRQAAEAGGAREQCDYAIACELEGDSTEAFRWFLRAADQGLAEAQYQVGLAYSEGLGVEPDPRKAVIWLARAAAQGYAAAYFDLGVAYATGSGVEADHRKAVEWFQRGAAQGHALSECGLGWMYLDGTGVPQNFEEAYFWLNVGASVLQGDEAALCQDKRDEALERIAPEQLAAAQRRALSYRRGDPQAALGATATPHRLASSAEDPEEADHRREMELEQMRFQNQMRLQAHQLRQLRRIEDARTRAIRRHLRQR
jgi:hypothetical protein